MRRLRSAACAALLLAGPIFARAEDACVADAKRLCPNVPYGEGAVVDCLRQRWSSVSSACQRTLQEVENKARQVSIDCYQDVFRYCPRVPRGKGRVLSCLAGNWADLSSTCQDAVGRVSEKLQKFRDSCSDDAARLCQGLEPGGGRIFACLKFQERALSSRCAAAMRL